MKRIIGAVCLIGLCCQFGIAQSVLPTATMTTIEGEKFPPESTVKEQFLLIHVFAHWCKTCIEDFQLMEEVYEEYGCNQADLLAVGLEAAGNDGQVAAFALDYGSMSGLPLVSGMDGNANKVVKNLSVEAYPAFVLAAPDGKIVQSDIWPANKETIRRELSKFGILEAECQQKSSDRGMESEITVFPNPAGSTATIEIRDSAENHYQINIFSSAGLLAYSDRIHTKPGQTGIEINTSGFSKGTYLIELEGEEGQKMVIPLECVGY